MQNHKPFAQWVDTLHHTIKTQYDQNHPFYNDPFDLKGIKVVTVTRFGQNLGFIMTEADVQNSAGEKLPGLVFIRGGSVAMLV